MSERKKGILLNIEKVTWVVSGERLFLSGTGLDISGGESEERECLVGIHISEVATCAVVLVLKSQGVCRRIE